MDKQAQYTEKFDITPELLQEYEKEICIMVLGGTKAEYIVGRLEPRMFTNSSFKKIISVSKALMKAKKEINLYTVMEGIPSDEQKELCEQLVKDYIVDVNCDFFIDRIIKCYLDRITERAKAVEDLKYVEKEKITYTYTDCLEDISEQSDLLLKEYVEQSKAPNFMYLGYKSLDRYIGGLRGGDVMVLAGGTSMGKTCFALNVARNIQRTHKVNFYSLEMSKLQLVNRLAAIDRNINTYDIRNFRLNDAQFASYKKFMNDELRSYKMNICQKYNITIEDIVENEKKSDSEIIFIDYLGLLSSRERYGSRYERVTDISRRIKLLSNEIGKPIILLHQLSRKYMEREDKKPILSDLRESGAIEQDADYVLFVHRPGKVDENIPDDEMEIIIAKNRHGECNVFRKLIFNGATQRVTDLEEVNSGV